MNEKEILREAMALSGTSQSELADRLGYSHQSAIGNLFNTKVRNSMRVDILVKMINAMGYDLIVRGREEVHAPGGASYIPEWKVSCNGSKE